MANAAAASGDWLVEIVKRTELHSFCRLAQALDRRTDTRMGKGISTGDFSEALAALLGNDAAGLSPAAIARLKEGWIGEHDAWQKRDLSRKRYVYAWADGIYLQARLEDEKQCILVLIGATPEGRKELVGYTDGARESAQDWRDLLLDLKRRGLEVRPELAIADGALGFLEGCRRKVADEPRATLLGPLLTFYNFPAEHWKHI